MSAGNDSEELLRLENLCISVPSHGRRCLAVDGVSLSVHKGEVFGLVGESGCGKSLTSLSIEGLLPEGAELAGGAVVFGGQNMLSLPPRERRSLCGRDIAMVFQEPMSSLNPLMRIQAQVEEPLKIHSNLKRDERRERVRAALTAVGLRDVERLMKSYPHELSGGMRQRVMIAMAAICHPRLLIADEPTTALDVNTQTQVLELLRGLNRDYGTAILFISHDLGLVKNLCTSLAVMYAGKIVERGRMEELLSWPAHEYTRGLLRSIPDKSRKGQPLDCIPGRVPAVSEQKAPCPFAPRCPKARSCCFELAPPALALSLSHTVYCHLPDGMEGFAYGRE